MSYYNQEQEKISELENKNIQLKTLLNSAINDLRDSEKDCEILKAKVADLQSQVEKSDADARQLFSDLMYEQDKVLALQSKLDEIEKQEPVVYVFRFPSGAISSILHRDIRSAKNHNHSIDGEIIPLFSNVILCKDTFQSR